jgi:heterodisulfide reductase subunit B2
MKEYIFYPGCSLETSAGAYHDSLMAILEPLGIQFHTIEDWNCCGATEFHSVSQLQAHALVGRNLALATKESSHSRTVVAPCSACYLNLAKTDHYMKEVPQLNKQVNQALSAGGLQYRPGSLQILHLLDIIVNDIDLDTVRQAVVRPLTGLRVAPYLGCMVPRPDFESRFSSTDYPTELDRLLKALGAEVVYYPLKTHCCGGHMTQITPTTAYEMIGRLIVEADYRKADLMATLCPMCQLNLDAYQSDTNRYLQANYNMPVLYFTQLMGLAFGKDPQSLGIGKEIVSASAALSRIGIQTPVEEPAPARKKKAKPEGLPMPVMPDKEEV